MLTRVGAQLTISIHFSGKFFEEWSFKKAIRIQTYSSYHPIPVPFNIISNLILGLLWVWRVCSRGRTVSPTIWLLNFAVASRTHLSICARVTLARGLHYLPCKRSAGDNSPNRVNFPPSCVTSNCANLNGIIQFLSLIINIWKIKRFFLSTMTIFSLFFEFDVFSIKNFKIVLEERVL